jgi:hypothetical protein
LVNLMDSRVFTRNRPPSVVLTLCR